MEPNCTNLTEKILQLTLEIIYLLTGENNIVAKKASGDGQESTTVPLCSLLFPERNNGKKILEVTKKITDLLIGEVFHPSYSAPEGLNVNEIKVEYTNEEEEEDVRGVWPCKKEKIKLERETDGSSNGNPPERCPRPLYSRDSTQEDHTIPHHHQSGSWSNFNITIKEEIKEEEEVGVMEEYLEGHKDLYKDVMMEYRLHLTSPDGSSNEIPSERCPCPLYSQDSTWEDHTIPHHYKGEEVIDMKIEVKAEEELYMRDDKLSMKESEKKLEITKEESALDISTGEGWNSPERHPILSRDCNEEDNGMAQYSSEVSLGTQYLHHRFDHVVRSTDPFNSVQSNDKSQTIIPNVQPSCHSADGSPDPSNQEESSNNLETWTKKDNEIFPSESLHNVGNQKVEFPFLCPECGKGFKMKRALHIHQMSHTGKKIYSCPDCEKLYITYCGLVAHMKLHAGEKPYTCFKCEASFGLRSQLTAHQKVHYEQKPFSCSECEKSFMTKQELVHHQRTHTGEKPFPCSECGRSFARTSQLKRHYRVHTGEKPFCCSECHKCFSTKMIRDNHMRVHTGERPYSCPDCCRCFTQKGALTVHQKKHYHTNRDC